MTLIKRSLRKKMENDNTAPEKWSRLAITSLVLSCLGFVVGLITIIPGIICAHLAVRDIKRNPHKKGKQMARTIMILGYSPLVIHTVLILVAMIFVAVSVMTKPDHPFPLPEKGYQQSSEHIHIPTNADK
jgi:hypothetical protein